MKPHSLARLAFFSLATLLLGPIAASAAVTNIVRVTGPNTYAFSPTNLFISTGDSVRWTNVSTQTHDVTPGVKNGNATNNPVTPQWAAGSLGLLGNFQVAFSNVGVYPYLCGRHVFGATPQLGQTGLIFVAQANLPPTVAIVSPGDLTRLTAPASFQISATAADADGSVTNVEFFSGATLLGSVSTPPYDFNVANLPAGWHPLIARASDNLGGVGVSPVVNVLVNSNRTVNVVTVGFNFTFSPSNFVVTVGDTVTFNGLGSFHTVTGSTNTEPFCGSTLQASCAVTFNSVGNFPFHCIPHRLSGMTGLVQVVGPNLKPVTELTSPGPGSVFAAPASIRLAATASDQFGAINFVRFIRGGNNLLGTVTNAPYSLTISNVAAGNYVYTSLAYDNTGLISTSAPVNVSVITPVDIQLLSPTATAGGFQFDYTANPGLTYIVEGSAADGSPVPFTPLATNVAGGNRVTFTDPNSGTRSNRAYRVLRQP